MKGLWINTACSCWFIKFFSIRLQKQETMCRQTLFHTNIRAISNFQFGVTKAFKINEKIKGIFCPISSAGRVFVFICVVGVLTWIANNITTSLFVNCLKKTKILTDQQALTAEKAKQTSKQGWAIWPKNNIKIYLIDLRSKLRSFILTLKCPVDYGHNWNSP